MLIKAHTAASQIAQQMAMNPGAMVQPNQDQHKLFVATAEDLEVIEHRYILDGIEERILATLG
jgi:ER membrane protein complex subunit 3